MRNFAVASFGRESEAEEMKSAIGEDDAERATNEREKCAFGEQLADDAAAACAEGCTEGDFTFAGSGASEDEIGDVDAGNQEDENHCAEVIRAGRA